MDTNRLCAQLIADEGKEKSAYQDNTPDKFWTIGVGRLIDKRLSAGLSDDEIMYLLNNDVQRTIGWLDYKYPWFVKMTEARQEAIANMAFNLGQFRFAGFKKMIAALELGNWHTAADEAMSSEWAKQVGNGRAGRIRDALING